MRVIAIFRVYLYVHYPIDVIAGAILGLIFSTVVIYLFNNVNNNHKASI